MSKHNLFLSLTVLFFSVFSTDLSMAQPMSAVSPSTMAPTKERICVNLKNGAKGYYDLLSNYDAEGRKPYLADACAAHSAHQNLGDLNDLIKGICGSEPEYDEDDFGTAHVLNWADQCVHQTTKP